jgi:hypothetical protein
VLNFLTAVAIGNSYWKYTKNMTQYLCGEIMTRNYQLVYYDAENVGFIGILAYPKIYFAKHNLCVYDKRRCVYFLKISCNHKSETPTLFLDTPVSL